MTAASWRLIIDDACDAAENMARDRALQESRESGEAPPTLRLYRWARPTVTLGRFQPATDVEGDACDRYGVDVVRRFTGGRGVLHDDELTYAVVAATDDGIPRGVAASYRMLSEVLAAAYRRLGVAEAEVVEHDAARARTAACYLATTRADLALGAAKLSGSAQVWHGATVLQHGSFVISRDVAREAAVFGLDEQAIEQLSAQAATLHSVLGRSPSIGEIADAVVAAFSAGMGIIFETATDLTPAEKRRVDLLREAVTVDRNDMASTSR